MICLPRQSQRPQGKSNFLFGPTVPYFPPPPKKKMVDINSTIKIFCMKAGKKNINRRIFNTPFVCSKTFLLWSSLFVFKPWSHQELSGQSFFLYLVNKRLSDMTTHRMSVARRQIIIIFFNSNMLQISNSKVLNVYIF